MKRIPDGHLFKTERRGETVWRGRFYVRWPKYRQIYVDVGPQSEYPDAKAARARLREIIRDTHIADAKVEAVLNSNAGRNARHSAGVPGIPRRSRGACAELLACSDLLWRGFEVFRSVNPLSPCDLVALKDGTFSRVEVKWGAVSEDGKPLCDYEDNMGSFDLLLVVTVTGAVHYFDSQARKIGHEVRQFEPPPTTVVENTGSEAGANL